MNEPRAVTLLVLAHIAKRLLPPILVIVLYTLLAAIVVQWDMHRVGEPTRTFGEELYAMYMQVFFQPTAPLPKAPVARAIFWVTPLVGTIAIGFLASGRKRRALPQAGDLDADLAGVETVSIGDLLRRVAADEEARGRQPDGDNP